MNTATRGACMALLGALAGCDGMLVIERTTQQDCGSGPTVTLGGQVVPCERGAPIGAPGCGSSFTDLEVCVKDCDGLCTTTSSTLWSLAVPAESEIVLLYSMSHATRAYLDSAGAVRTGTEDDTGAIATMLTQAAAEELANAANFAWPLDGRSLLTAGVSWSAKPDSGVVGSQVWIDPPAILGPIYADETGLFDPGLSSASKAGWVLFLVEPGEYVLRARTLRGESCGPANYETWEGGWPGPTEDAMRLPALADRLMALAWFRCR